MMSNSFYDSRYVNQREKEIWKLLETRILKDDNGQMVLDESGSPVFKDPPKSQLFNALCVLKNSNYRYVAVVGQDEREIMLGKGMLIQELGSWGVGYKYSMVNNSLNVDDMVINFYSYKGNRDINRLKGPNFDSAIVVGKPSEDFMDVLNQCLRLGDNPIKISF
jgi:hypothetical protein